ncbi:UDP-Glycosyltransferase/glycogen phosphorylase, partial [Rhizoclosmatium globosum]
MKVAFLVFGSRGDVQPYVAMAKELIDRGIPALMFAQKPFQNWIESEGIEFSLIPGDLSHDVSQPEMIKAILSGDMRPFMPLFYDKHRIGKTLFHILDTVQADKSISLIVTATSLGFISPYIYHYSNVPTCTVHLIPTGQPTSQIPSLMIPVNLPFGLSHRIQSVIMNPIVVKPITTHFQTLDFSHYTLTQPKNPNPPPLKSFPKYYSFSHNILPRPTDWPSDIPGGGSILFKNRATTDTLSPRTQSFLDNGSEPVYIGFGSMPADLSTNYPAFINDVIKHSPADTRFIVFSRNMSNSRDILTESGKSLHAQWDGTKRVLVVGSEPHHVLFPRCKVIVHHGGAGTTAEAARAGKVQVVCPFGFDQTLWARVVVERGVGVFVGYFREL